MVSRHAAIAAFLLVPLVIAIRFDVQEQEGECTHEVEQLLLEFPGNEDGHMWECVKLFAAGLQSSWVMAVRSRVAPKSGVQADLVIKKSFDIDAIRSENEIAARLTAEQPASNYVAKRVSYVEGPVPLEEKSDDDDEEEVSQAGSSKGFEVESPKGKQEAVQRPSPRQRVHQVNAGFLVLEEASGDTCGVNIAAEHPDWPRKSVMQAYCQAYSAIWRAGVAHGDINGNNELYNPKEQKLTIIDFGFSKTFLNVNHDHIEGTGLDALRHDVYMILRKYYKYCERTGSWKESELDDLSTRIHNILETWGEESLLYTEAHALFKQHKNVSARPPAHTRAQSTIFSTARPNPMGTKTAARASSKAARNQQAGPTGSKLQLPPIASATATEKNQKTSAHKRASSQLPRVQQAGPTGSKLQLPPIASATATEKNQKPSTHKRASSKPPRNQQAGPAGGMATATAAATNHEQIIPFNFWAAAALSVLQKFIPDCGSASGLPPPRQKGKPKA